MDDLVSVVMLSFNNMSTIGISLEALSKSTYTNMETIVLDCASRDNSPEYISKNFPWVQLTRFKKDPGPDIAYTYGVKKARGNHVLLLSADVRVLPNTIADLVRNMNEGSLDVAVPACLDWNGKYTNAGIGASFFNVGGYDLFLYFLRKLFFNVRREAPFYFIFACCMVKRDVYLETPFNQHIGFYEDVEWSWRLDLKKKKVKVLEDVYCLHKTGSSVAGRRAVYFGARMEFATFLICAKADVVFFISLPLTVTQLVRLLTELAKGKVGNCKSMVYGWADVIKSIPYFLQDRKILASQVNLGSFNFLERLVMSDNYVEKRRHLIGKKIMDVSNV